MAKFVHVDSERVRSGMRRFDELTADDVEWAAERQRLAEEVDEIRLRRDREHALKVERSSSEWVSDHLAGQRATADDPSEAD